MKKTFLFLILVLLTTQFSALAERINVPGLDIPKLIISEVRPDSEASAYVEITNMGDTAINLEPFTLWSVFYNTRMNQYSDSLITISRTNDALDSQIGKIYLKGILQPGESYVVGNVWDANNSRGSGIPRHNTAIAEFGDQFAHRSESLNRNGWIDKPEWQCYGYDSVSVGKHVFLRATNTAGYLLHWVYTKDGVEDSTFVDQFNHFWYPDDNVAIGFNRTSKGPWIFPIAGVADAMTSSIMVRKASIQQGSLNWETSRGVDAETSEWLVIPKNTSQQLVPTTFGSHGEEYALDYTVKDPELIIVDESAKTISVPWQMVRGDSLSRYFDLGPGMTWSYDLVGSFEDTASYIARTGDMWAFYAVGNTIDTAKYEIIARDATDDAAFVFPRRRLLVDEEIVVDEETGAIDTVYTRYWSNGFVYALSEGPEIDSIINVPFATRTDSLLKYLDKPEKATWEFIFVDGEDRVDLKFGDKLKVISENGANEKEYFIAVSEHVLSNNAFLQTVTWPDIDPAKYVRWDKGDTLPDFTSLKTLYEVPLRFDANQIPAFQFKPQNLRAKVEITNAMDLDGNLDQRTTTVKVTAESDTTYNIYKFVFFRQNAPIQPNIAEPFISQMNWNNQTQGCAFEIYNPGTEDLDLSQYMYVAGALTQTWQEAVETTVPASSYTSNDGIKIYQTHYVPSKRWRNDGSQAEWGATPTEDNPYAGAGWLIDDNQTDPWVKGGDVFVAGVGTSATRSTQIKIRNESDFIFRGTGDTRFAWDSTLILHRETPIWNDPMHNMWLLKMVGEKGDSIRDGIKNVRDASAYQLIDRFEVIGVDTIAGRRLLDSHKHNWALIRKPEVQKGNLERIGGAKSTPESSEWIVKWVNDPGVGWNNLVADIGVHNMNPITNYLSTVTSLKFIVTPGYQGNNLSITGSITDYTPTTISAELDKAEASQTFTFKRGETVLGADESLADGDILEVLAGNGENLTVYKLINSPLDNNTSLTAKDGSGLSVSNNKVSGATVGMKLMDVLAQLEVAEKSILNVLDRNGALQPLKVHGIDTLVYDVLVNESVMLQVVAENNDKAVYTFDLGIPSNEAVLFSDMLSIDQDRKVLMDFPQGVTAPAMLAMVYANEGATVKIIDKQGFERSTGFMNLDDRIQVTAADGETTVNYRLSVDLSLSSKGITWGSEDLPNLYPNPVNYVLYIDGFEVSQLDIYSLSGTLMRTKSNYSQSVDVSDLPSGAYIIRMTGINGKVITDKFLKN